MLTSSATCAKITISRATGKALDDEQAEDYVLEWLKQENREVEVARDGKQNVSLSHNYKIA
jgi:post-segregation antitoxin (ccd killing protein)